MRRDRSRHAGVPPDRAGRRLRAARTAVCIGCCGGLPFVGTAAASGSPWALAAAGVGAATFSVTAFGVARSLGRMTHPPRP
jgi:hypothetical protein